MQSSSAMSGMSQKENQVRFEPRDGQQELIDWLEKYLEARSLNISWPGGYGKSIGIALAYLKLRAAKAVDRLLIVVANDTQRQQVCEDFLDDFRLVGGDLLGDCVWRFSLEPLTTRLSKENRCEVFVTTIATVHSQMQDDRDINILSHLISVTGSSWMIAADECHHIAKEEGWGGSMQKLWDHPKVNFMLAVSATHERDGVPHIFGKPDIQVTYKEAHVEKAVKMMVCHKYKYDVEYIHQGEPLSFTTDDLRESVNGASSVDRYEVKHDLRHATKYVQPLLHEPLSRLVARRLETGKPLQMLIRAMGCEHAKHICSQVKKLCEGLEVDWIGTGEYGRPDIENIDIKRRFVPRKVNGQRDDPTLDILVQVGMAGEGFDAVNVVEIVDLAIRNLEGTANETAQFYLRGSRWISGLDDEQQVCNVSVPSDHPLAGAGATLMDWLDNPQNPKNLPKENPGTSGPVDWPPLPPISKVNELYSVELMEVTSESPSFKTFVENANEAARNEGRRPWDMNDPEDVERALAFMKIVIKEDHKRQDTDAEVIAKKRQFVDRAAGQVAKRAVTKSFNGSIPSASIGDFKKRVNSRVAKHFGYRDAMLEDDLDRAYCFLKQLDDDIIQGDIPSWLQ